MIDLTPTLSLSIQSALLAQIDQFRLAGKASTLSALVVIGYSHARTPQDLTDFAGRQLLDQHVNSKLEQIADGLVVKLSESVFMIGVQGESKDTISKQVDCILEQIQKHKDFSPEWVDVNAHAGIAYLSKTGQCTKDAVDAAMKAYAVSQTSDSRRLVIYTQDMNSITSCNRLIEEFYYAMNSDGLRLAYQPIFTPAHTVHGCEALLRWEHEDGSMRYPGDFLPMIERTSLMIALGRWVFDAACRQLHDWRAQHLETVRWKMFINVSRAQLKPSFLRFAIDTLCKYKLEPSDIELEITESHATTEHETAIKTLQALHDHGFNLAIDDLGTGYSTMLSIKNIPARTLKIDRSFVSTIDESIFSREIVRLTIEMSKNLGLSTVAEGVETQQQLEAMLELGCDTWQGYMGSPPLFPEEIERRLLC